MNPPVLPNGRERLQSAPESEKTSCHFWPPGGVASGLACSGTCSRSVWYPSRLSRPTNAQVEAPPGGHIPNVPPDHPRSLQVPLNRFPVPETTPDQVANFRHQGAPPSPPDPCGMLARFRIAPRSRSKFFFRAAPFRARSSSSEEIRKDLVIFLPTFRLGLDHFPRSPPVRPIFFPSPNSCLDFVFFPSFPG